MHRVAFIFGSKLVEPPVRSGVEVRRTMPLFAVKYTCCPVARFSCLHEANNPSGPYLYCIARLFRSLTTTTATTGTRSRLMIRSFASPKEGARTTSVQAGAWKKSILNKRSVSADANNNDFYCTSILSSHIHGHNAYCLCRRYISPSVVPCLPLPWRPSPPSTFSSSETASGTLSMEEGDKINVFCYVYLRVRY